MKTISATASCAGVITGWVSLIHHRAESIFQRPKSISEQNQHWSARLPAAWQTIDLCFSHCRRSVALTNVKCLTQLDTNLTFIAVFGSLDDCVVNLHFMLIFCQVSPPSCFPWLISPVTGASHDMSPTFVTVSRVTWSGHFVSRSMTATMIDTLCVTSEVSPDLNILYRCIFPSLEIKLSSSKC